MPRIDENTVRLALTRGQIQLLLDAVDCLAMNNQGVKEESHMHHMGDYLQTKIMVFRERDSFQEFKDSLRALPKENDNPVPVGRSSRKGKRS